MLADQHTWCLIASHLPQSLHRTLEMFVDRFRQKFSYRSDEPGLPLFVVRVFEDTLALTVEARMDLFRQSIGGCTGR